MVAKYPVSIPEDTAEDLKTIADILGPSVPRIIRRAIEQYVASYIAD